MNAPADDHPLPRAPGGESRRGARRRSVVWARWLALGASLVLLGSAAVFRVARVRAVRAGYVTAMKRDLVALAEAQGRYREAHGRFGTVGAIGRDYVPSQGVTVVVGSADETGWAATAVHSRSPVSCSLAVQRREADGVPEPVCR